MLNSASPKQIVAAVSIRRTEGEIQHIAEAATAIVPVRIQADDTATKAMVDEIEAQLRVVR